MKNTLNKFNKIIVFSFGIAAALILVTSLVYFDCFTNLATDYLNGELNTTVRTTRSVLRAFYGDNDTAIAMWHNVDDFYRAAQTFNQSLYVFSIVMLITFAVTLIASNHSRIKFFLSNLIVGVAANVFAIIYSIVILTKNFNVASLFNKYKTELSVYDTVTSVGWSAATSYANGGTLEQYFTLKNSASILTTIVLVLFIIVAVINLAFTILKFIYTNRKVEE